MKYVDPHRNDAELHSATEIMIQILICPTRIKIPARIPVMLYISLPTLCLPERMCDLRLPLVEDMWIHWGQCHPLEDLAT
jgi:hypothetical protein